MVLFLFQSMITIKPYLKVLMDEIFEKHQSLSAQNDVKLKISTKILLNIIHKHIEFLL